MRIEYRFLQHKATGDWFAVRMTDGQIVAGSGPLARLRAWGMARDLEPLGQYLVYTRSIGQLIGRSLEEFREIEGYGCVRTADAKRRMSRRRRLTFHPAPGRHYFTPTREAKGR